MLKEDANKLFHLPESGKGSGGANSKNVCFFAFCVPESAATASTTGTVESVSDSTTSSAATGDVERGQEEGGHRWEENTEEEEHGEREPDSEREREGGSWEQPSNQNQSASQPHSAMEGG